MRIGACRISLVLRRFYDPLILQENSIGKVMFQKMRCSYIRYQAFENFYVSELPENFYVSELP